MTQPILIDTHAHLNGERFSSDLDEVIQRATSAGVRNIITVGCDCASSLACVELANNNPAMYAAVGIHPHDAEQFTPAVFEQLRCMAQQPKVVAIGEIGLDYYRNHCPHEVQQQTFRQQIQLAQQCQLPIIVHDRDAHIDMLNILKEERANVTGGVLHCFSGDLALAKNCIAMGFYLSFTGTITYPRNEAISEVIRHIPIEHILVETDCPYLAPQQWRGQRNEPSYVVKTAAKIAEIKQLTLDDIGRITTLNAQNLFGIGSIDKANKHSRN